MKTLILVTSLLFGAAAAAGGVQSYLHSASGEAQVTFHADGSRKNSTEYVEGRKHGKSEQWRRNGSLEWQGEFREGLKCGEWRYFDESGALDTERSGLYENGERVAALPQ
jgi:antitoxin component YwqK of YwqJK toxin-antitoxin module